MKGQATQRAREQLDTRSTQLGKQLSTYGRALRTAADQLEIEGHTGEAKTVGQAAEQVHKLAGYFTQSSSDRFLGDLESFGRQRPWVAGGIGLAAGFLAARFMKASSESRYASTYQMPLDSNLPLTRDDQATVTLPPVPAPPYGTEG